MLHLVERDPNEISGRVLSGEAAATMAFRMTMREWAVVCDGGVWREGEMMRRPESEKKGRTRTKVLTKVTIRPGQSNQVKSRCVKRLHAVKRAVEMSRLAAFEEGRDKGRGREGGSSGSGCPGLALTWS